MGRGQDRRSVLLTAPEASRPSAWTDGHPLPVQAERRKAWGRSRGEADWSGPVSRVLCPPHEAADGDHFSRTQIALGLEQPTRKWGRGGPPRAAPSRRTLRSSSCLALLPMGFAEPDRSPGLLVSSYLTVSPLPTERTPQAVCFLWHFPWPRGRWALPTIAPCGARTFLPPAFPKDAETTASGRWPAIIRSAPVQCPVYAADAAPAGSPPKIGPKPIFLTVEQPLP